MQFENHGFAGDLSSTFCPQGTYAGAILRKIPMSMHLSYMDSVMHLMPLWCICVWLALMVIYKSRFNHFKGESSPDQKADHFSARALWRSSTCTTAGQRWKGVWFFHYSSARLDRQHHRPRLAEWGPKMFQDLRVQQSFKHYWVDWSWALATCEWSWESSRLCFKRFVSLRDITSCTMVEWSNWLKALSLNWTHRECTADCYTSPRRNERSFAP